ncbi:hypothetical protein NLJ89_g6245 [Agrocybe chaxingu]|uniref:Uncharacterized protein n=1 Tax=Agrocybe chaxingu TaxID=84603 RepID=A0A9W8K148_9AGAR|nr:hypothetical protein NLJ89_g6245 [Agrocybe chaxingu]
MSSHSPLPKQYEDKVVQTNTTVLSLARDTLPSITPESISEHSSGCLSALNFSDPETETENTAYMHSHAQAVKNSDPPTSQSTCPARKVWIESSRPSAFDTTFSKRVVSLPDTLDEAAIPRVEKQLRIVSMPEQRYEHSEPALGIAFSPDDNIGAYEHVCGSNYNRPYPSDLPQTPSPPSSPDSVMIIGHESHIPNTLHRNSCSADEDGQSFSLPQRFVLRSTSQVGSLGRTLLHAQFLLCTALSPCRMLAAHRKVVNSFKRCLVLTNKHSGAEGTVIEGDDLSNKIWGLGGDDSQNASRSTRNNNDTSVLPGSFNAIDYHESQSSSQRQRDTVIDLAMPSTFGDRTVAPAGLPRRMADTGASFGSLHNTHNRSQVEHRFQETSVFRGASRNPDFRHPQVDANHLSRNIGDPLGLGLKWSSLSSGGTSEYPTANNQVGPARESRLNTAAPVFVPENSVRTRNDAYSRPVGGGQDRAYFSRPLSTVGISQRYRAQQDYNLPTPPSSSSTQWSPVFSRQPDPVMYSSAQKNPGHALPNQQDPGIYSPQSDLDDYSRHLLMLMQQIQTGREGDVMHETSASLESLVLQGESALNVARYSTPATPQIPSSALLESQPHLVSDVALAVEDQNALTASACDRRRNLSYQHPRSIPLARLIQRRLSSVAEEDISAANLDYSMSMLKSIHMKPYFDRQQGPIAPKVQQGQNQANRLASGSESEARKKDEPHVDSLDNHQAGEVAGSSGPARFPRKQSGVHPSTTHQKTDAGPGDGRGPAANDSSFEKENVNEGNELPRKSRPEAPNRKKMRYRRRGSTPSARDRSSEA